VSWPWWLVIAYLSFGISNYAGFAARGGSILFRPRPELPDGMAPYRPAQRRDLAEGLFEAGFFVLLWPVQLAYFVATRVALPAARWAGERLLP
jgi:hypothetical protein